ncbi:SAM-dependent methyltransferase [Spinactinospora alkalitolerans]|nr:SAM-dependent methyltransferase [Spinactinospora alkalitolerans]
MKSSVQNRTPPPEIDTTKPSIARVYSYYLGGKDHFQVDRDMADYASKVVPGLTDIALGNREFVQRSVRYMARDAGIRQFLDIGSGLPTDGNVHEIAHESTPDAHVVYVDNDPIVLAHGRALLEDKRGSNVITADLTRPEEIIGHPVTRELIDFGEPVGLVLGGILHHLHDWQEPRRVAAELCGALAPGSHVAVSHFHRPDEEEFPDDADRARLVEEAFLEKLGHGRWRTREEILACFGGLELVEPGLVPCQEWRAGPDTHRMADYVHRLIVGGVGRKA